MTKRAYYARCMAIYGTRQEQRNIEDIQKAGFYVITFPPQPIINRWRKANPNGDVMAKFFRPLVESADVLFYTPVLLVENGLHVTSGVQYEIEVAQELGLPIFQTDHEWPSLDISQTRAYIRGELR